jgi:NAD(P)-dependent dehydrogenase (short-subunit alcohol dehydrogenase family)
MADRSARGAVLITGCSSGIGRATALALARAGREVYATARRIESLDDLERAGCRTLELDVTDEGSMASAVETIDARTTIGALVNNAGYGLYGPVEQVPISEVRRQFETNVFGLTRLIQLVLPGMRRRRTGTIVNVSSMGGRITLPGGAFYHASKHAVESLSDALRIEVAPFGVNIVLVEPGPVDTPWNDVAAQSVAAAEAPAEADEASGDAGADPYAVFKAAVTAAFYTSQQGVARRLSSRPEDIARVIARALDSPNPRTRYLVGGTAHGLVALNAVLPDRLYDAVVRRSYGLG